MEQILAADRNRFLTLRLPNLRHVNFDVSGEAVTVATLCMDIKAEHQPTSDVKIQTVGMSQWCSLATDIVFGVLQLHHCTFLRLHHI